MAHELTGDKAAAYYRNPAWHDKGLFSATEPFANATAAAVAAKIITHRLVKEPVYRLRTNADGSTDLLEVMGQYALVRQPLADVVEDESVMQIVTDQYSAVQIEDVCAIVDPISTPDKFPVSSIGLLGTGADRFFMALEMEPSYLNGDENEEHRHYLTVLDDYGKGGAMRVLVTTTRVVCANTYAVAVNDTKNMITIDHVGDAKSMLDLSIQMQMAALENRRSAVTAFEAMMKFAINKDQARAVIEAAYVPDNKPESLNLLDKPEFTSLSLDRQMKARERAIKATEAWHNSIKRAEGLRVDAYRFYEKFNDEHSRYGATMYALVNAINENSDFNDSPTIQGESKSWHRRGSKATQIYDGDRAMEKNRAWFKALEIMGAN